MRYAAAYLLAVLGGKQQQRTWRSRSSVGHEADSDKLKKAIDVLKGKSVEDLIVPGCENLSSMPVGGAATADAAATATAAAAAVEEKKEEKVAKREESESDDEDMGFGLFD